MRSKSDITFKFLPPTRLPAIYVELIGVESRDRHGRIGCREFICSNIFGAQFETTALSVCGFGQAVDRQTQVRQYIVVNDVVKKYGLRIERFRRQDDTVVKGFVFGDRSTPVSAPTPNSRSIAMESL